MLAAIDDPERLAEVCNWLMRCETGGEFVAPSVHPAVPESVYGSPGSVTKLQE